MKERRNEERTEASKQVRKQVMKEGGRKEDSNQAGKAVIGRQVFTCR